MGGHALISSAEALEVEPLYPATRLLKQSDLECEQLLEDAREVAARAERERERLLQQAETERQAILQAAQAQAEDARRAGFEAGRKTARTEVAALLESLTLQAKALRDAYPEDVRKTAFQIAGSVLRARFQHEPELIQVFVAEALVKARHRTGLTLYLHPQDLPLVQEALDALARSLALGVTPSAVADDDVPRHGLRLESEAGAAWHVDLEDRLGELERRIGRELARGKGRR